MRGGEKKDAQFNLKIRPSLMEALDGAKIFVAHNGKSIAGWIAWVPGMRYDVVRWVYVRREHRGRGVMRQLVERAMLAHRIVYVFRSPLDEGLARWLMTTGITSVVYEPWERWKA